MSIHPSLKIDLAGAQHKTVHSRIQRVKSLMKKGTWLEGQAVTGLPKTKILKIKTKKTKAAKEATPGAATDAAAAPAEKGKKA
jgi:small basic protein (TIGR04137 family)